MDQSALEGKYFIDLDKYNCPFCNVRSVAYFVTHKVTFDWTKSKKAYVYLVICGNCQLNSAHFSYRNIQIKFLDQEESIGKFLNESTKWDVSRGGNVTTTHFQPEDMDKEFFFHKPTSFFTIDNRIPNPIRDLVSEAEGCAKMNYYVGASGALRKAIYELIKNKQLVGKDYKNRIKDLKKKVPSVSEDYVDALANIQDMTSGVLHEKEGNWNAFEPEDFLYLLEVSKALLKEVYVDPEEKKKRLSDVLKIKGKKTKESSDKETS